MQRPVVMPPLFCGAACQRLLHREKKQISGNRRKWANFGACVMHNRYAFILCGQNTMEAEGVRFELTRPFGLPVFKTGAINRSATPPENGWATSNVQRPTSNSECRKLLSLQR